MDILNINSLTNYAKNMATTSSVDKLSDKADSLKDAKTDEELMDACKEFENYLWEQVLKSMKSTVNFTGEGENESPTVDYFMDSAISDVAKDLTNQNLGPNSLAMQMYEQMKREGGINPELLNKDEEQ